MHGTQFLTMTVIHSIVPRSTDSQSLLQNSYFIAAVAIVVALVILRIIVLRWRNQALSNFFHMGGNSQHGYGSHPPHDSNHGAMYHGLQLAPLPSAYRSDRRVRATDTDALGRRLDPTGANLDGKDALPAYDNLDRPPKYVEASWTHGGPSLPMEQSAVTPYSEGEQSGMAVHTVDQPFYHTHAVANVIHGTEAPPPPIHHGLSSS